MRRGKADEDPQPDSGAPGKAPPAGEPPGPGQLNPLPVEPTKEPDSTSSGFFDADGTPGLIATLMVAITPILCDGIFTAVIGGRAFYAVGPFHIGIAFFGITLAAIVRILSHGRGPGMLPVLGVAALVEVVLALYFGGTFSKGEIDRQALRADMVVLTRSLKNPQAMESGQVLKTRTDLREVERAAPAPSAGGYIVIIVSGVISTWVLIAYWAPPTEEERRREGGGNFA
ncbi:MAG: hypothetical protein ACTHK6_07070 [Solirubrobacterales bacterium]